VFDRALDGRSIRVKTRSMRPPVPAKFIWSSEGLAVDLEDPMEGIAPGQACVFYDTDQPSRTLGGGWIVQAE